MSENIVKSKQHNSLEQKIALLGNLVVAELCALMYTICVKNTTNKQSKTTESLKSLKNLM